MRKFLIVDDNIALADNLAEIIADADLGEPMLADGGARALVLAADTRFDVLVSDVRMPNMSGVELVQRMRLVDSGLPAILVTAYTAACELGPLRHEGVLCILPKPVPIVRLLDLLACARRDGVVALVGPETALRDSLAEAMRSNGFAPVTARSLSEVATFGASPFAVVVDIRTLSDLDCDALLLMATTLLPLPILTVATKSQRSRPVPESYVSMAWPSPDHLMKELESLCDRRRFMQSEAS